MKKQLSTRDLCIAALFAVLTAACAQLMIPLPFTPVPISFGIAGVYITAILLTPRCAVMSQLCYLLLGAAGLPVFGGFRGGVGVLLGPTGGYLLVYPVVVWIVSYTLNSRRAARAESSKIKTLIKATLSIFAAHAVLYTGGTIWLAATTGTTFFAALALAVVPFIPMDIVKIVFCIVAVLPLRERVARASAH